MTFTIVWHDGEPIADKQEAIWFYGGANPAATATLEKNGQTYSVDIYCDGETLAKIPYTNDDGTLDEGNFQYLRYENEFEAAGVKNDDDLSALSDKYPNYDVWVHNSWFDLYDPNGEHLDAVTHEVPNAAAAAQEVLEQVAAAGGWEKYWEM